MLNEIFIYLLLNVASCWRKVAQSISFQAKVSTIRGVRTGIEIPSEIRAYIPKGGNYQITISALGTIAGRE